jgi:hypothetical protein
MLVGLFGLAFVVGLMQQSERVLKDALAELDELDKVSGE